MALSYPPASQLQPPPQRQQRAPSPRLIVADATLELVARWKAELAVLRRRSPASDAVKTLAECVQELAEAITAGREVSVQLTIAEAHALSRIPVSTLRWLCNHKPETVGARKREGTWYLDRSCFEAYLASSEGRGAIPLESVPQDDAPVETERVTHRVTDTGADFRVEGA
jgi:hypothetical protein